MDSLKSTCAKFNGPNHGTFLLNTISLSKSHCPFSEEKITLKRGDGFLRKRPMV